MTKPNIIPYSSSNAPYTLVYHLLKAGNPRLQAKIRAMVKILPEKYNLEVRITKRRIWFFKNGKRFIQVMVGKKKLFVKIKTGKKWQELAMPDWEDLRRVYWILEKIN